MLTSGVAEKTSEAPPKKGRVYYMPHRAVYREDKSTTKTRIVFDASSSEKGLLSLNENLCEGEDMVANLLGTLLRFRSNLYAIISDIEKAFLQISIDPEDRDVHRFWWFADLPENPIMLPDPIVYRMTRVTFGVTSSPFLLASTIKTHLNNCKPKYGKVCEKLKNSFYVDDLVLSESREGDARKIIVDAYEIMSSANFHLRKWNSNNIDILKQLPQNVIANVCNQKVLGIKWCTNQDEISVDLEGCAEYVASLKGTKRNVLKAMAKIYDPIGIIGPFTVRIKILLQKIWNAGLDWDESLPKQLSDEFTAWQNELPSLKEYTIKRCLFEKQNCINELHIFADASPYAYGAVAYIRQKTTEGVILTKLICSKNRIRPMKKGSKEGDLTLPKLELTAALIAARLKEFLDNSFETKFNKISLWADSTIALDWISGRGKNLQPYVRTRVNEINKLTNVYDWRHCQGKSNPADLLTRGIKAKHLNDSELWRFGPTWLMEGEINEATMITGVLELMTTAVKPAETSVAVPHLSLLEISDYSSMKRLLRVTAWVFRFINIIRKRKLKTSSKVIIYNELKEAENYWVKFTQASCFNIEINSLMQKDLVSPQSKIYNLNPILVNGIIKLQSRLPRSDESSMNPTILPKHCHLSKLLIEEAHQNTLHGGINVVLTQIRKKYWIIQGRQMIKQIVQKCVVCKRLRGKPGSEPWTVIPIERINTTKPFQTTGIDFAGPLYVSDSSAEGQRKVYILLFTCAAIRAVHLELLSDMTVKSCIQALRRFCARYGTPKIVISDNAKTFKRADAEFRKLENLMKNDELQQIAAHKGIHWKYIPERAAWWGGFWERLVKSVKTCLKSAIGKARLTFEELFTVLAEVEGIVNARPLTYVSNDHNDLEPLSPAHFLNNASLLLPAEFKSDGTEIAKSWELKQIITKKYLQRWKTEYVNQLRSLHFNKNNNINSIKSGDVVLVHEDIKPRLLWKLALVQNTFPGRDGRVRVCEIRMSNGNVLKRPVQLLYPLEISLPGGRM